MRASSTHSAMATRAGVPECSTSHMAVRSSARSIRASPVTGYWGARRAISASIESRFADDRRDELAGQLGRRRIAFVLGEMALEDGVRRPLPEVRLEDRRRARAGGRSVDPGPGQPPTPSTRTVTEPRSRPSRRSTVAATAERTCVVERPEGLARAGDDPDPDLTTRSSRNRTLTARPPRSTPPRAPRRGRRARRPGPRGRPGGRARR